MHIFDEFEQGSPEWFEARMGIPTSSQFATVMAKNRKGDGPGKTRQTYMRKLAGELLTGEPMDNFTNAHMERGKQMEDEARNFYSFMTDSDPRQVAFIRSNNTGCSPDALIGEKGMLEVKTKLPHLLIELIERDQFPPEHKAQIQGQLWIAKREWCDLAVYWPGLPLLVKREVRDDDYIKTLSEEVERFNTELYQLVDRVKAYNTQREAA